jgi:hypothetical protein
MSEWVLIGPNYKFQNEGLGDGSLNQQSRGPTIRYSGISPDRLLQWVLESAPYVFEIPDAGAHPEMGWLSILRGAQLQLPDLTDLYGYFDLCLAAHFSTVGSFVPTDVDLAIREKLWSFVHSGEVLGHLWSRVRDFHDWDESRVSNRWVKTREGARLSGIQGEWLTIAMGAYGTARRISSSQVGQIREAIEQEVCFQESALLSLRQSFEESPEPHEMKRYLGGVAAVAHNLGDLDRMFDAYALEETDVLKRRVYRAGHEDARSPRPALVQAGNIYQALIASENHRNFALRAPKALRRSPRFLLPFGLFLDDWGRLEVGAAFREGLLSEGDLREIIEALVEGWQRLNPRSIYTSQGYARALAGISKALGGRQELESAVPPSVRKVLVESGLRTLLGVSQEEFERKVVGRLRRELEKAPA